MKIVKEEKQKQTVYCETPSTCFLGDVREVEVEITKNITVELNSSEYSKLVNILALSEKQYQKFLKKFRS